VRLCSYVCVRVCVCVDVCVYIDTAVLWCV
jgi:hypothetical protein